MRCAKHQDMAAREFRRRMKLDGPGAQRSLRAVLKTLDETDEALRTALAMSGHDPDATLRPMLFALKLLAFGHLAEASQKGRAA